MGGNVLDRFRLDGKVAIVTGGARGLGRVIADALASAGADVALTARQAENAQRAAEVIATTSARKTLGVAADVTSRASVEAMVAARAWKTLGRIDILVNNAGVNIRGPIEELSEDDWDTVVDTNLKGPWLCCRAVGPIMKKQKWGRVINVSSMLGEISLPGTVAVCLEQGGPDAPDQDAGARMGQGRHQRQRPLPRTVRHRDQHALLNDPAARAQMEANVPLARWGDPVELGPAAVFLASDAASFMTGATLFIDGGYTAR